MTRIGLANRARAAIRSLVQPAGRRPTWPGALTQGGFVNPATGAGVPGLDKSEAALWVPARFQNRQEIETLYVQSWAARKFISIPVDDCFLRWREWSGEDDAANDAMRDAEERHQPWGALAMAMRAGRLYGTGLLVMVTRDGALDTELVPERLRPGDLSHLLVFDRFSAAVMERDDDILSPTFGQPLSYALFPSRAATRILVHASRIIRFDGIQPTVSDGWTVYDRDWGVSDLVPAILAIIQDATSASGAAHLTQEASIPFMRVDGFREALEGGGDPGEVTPNQLGESISALKSMYRTIFMDKSDEFGRVSVTWSGLPEIMDRFAQRLAAAADIPMTRFWGRSPAGMNSTGEHDMANYAIAVAARQERLRPQIARLDEVLARDAGLDEPPPYMWPSLIDLSETDQATVLKMQAEALRAALDAAAIDEDEMRAALAANPIFPDGLPGPAPEVPEPEPAPDPVDRPITTM